VVYFSQVSPPQPCAQDSFFRYMLHNPDNSFFLIWRTEKYLLMNIDHKDPHYLVCCTACYLIPLRPKYSPQHPIYKHPQPTFLTQYERRNITPIQTTGNYTVLNVFIYIFLQKNAVRQKFCLEW
jgi:hypothetical protein